MSGKLRMTRQRQVILEELRQVTSHPTASEIHTMVRKRLPRISLGTVYRNLDILSEQGLVRKMATGTAARRYDGDIGNHYHLCCVRCGLVEDIPPGMVSVAGEHIGNQSGFEVVGHRLKFLGLCPRCREERS